MAELGPLPSWVTRLSSAKCAGKIESWWISRLKLTTLAFLFHWYPKLTLIPKCNLKIGSCQESTEDQRRGEHMSEDDLKWNRYHL